MRAAATAPRRIGATFAIVAVVVCLAAGSSLSGCSGQAPTASTLDGASPLTSDVTQAPSPRQATATAGPARWPSNPEADTPSHIPGGTGTAAASFSLYASIDRGGGEDSAIGWVLDIAVSGGVSSQSTLVTSDDDEEVPITVVLDAPRAVVSVMVHMKAGYLLQDGYCVDLAEEPEEDPETGEPGERTHLGVLTGTKISFELAARAAYACNVVVRPRKLPPATIIVRAMMDPNPDTDAGEGRGGAGWRFNIAVTGGSPTSTLIRTGSNGEAKLKVVVDLGSARVRIRERQRAAAPYVRADCWDSAGEDPIAGGFTADGTAVTFSVEPGGVYVCEMLNRGDPAT